MTRRKWLALSAVTFSASCGRKNGTGFPGYALIATAGETSLAIVDLADFRLLRSLPLGGAPQQVFASSAARAAYVSTPGTGSLHAIAADLQRRKSNKLADELSGFRPAQDGRRLWAISSPSRELIEVDAQSLQARSRWKLPAEPASLDVSADGSIAVSTGQHGTVQLVDAKTGRQTTRDLGGPLGEVKFRPDGKVLLAANYHEQVLTVLEVPSLDVIVHLPLAMQPGNLCFNADGGQLFITGKGMDAVAIAFPYLPLEVEQTVLAGRDPGVMACSAAPAFLFVASASGSDVCILNVDNRKMIGLVEVGQKPSFIAVTPDSQYALVLNENSGDVAVIHITSIQAKTANAAKMRGKSGAALFTMLPVGNRPVHAAIVPKPV